MRGISKMVERVLKDVPESRNSDITLTEEIWKRYFKSRLKLRNEDQLLYVSLKDIHELPREDHVKRIRAKFNEKKMYMPTDPEVIKRRRHAEKSWRKDLGYGVNNDES